MLVSNHDARSLGRHRLDLGKSHLKHPVLARGLYHHMRRSPESQDFPANLDARRISVGRQTERAAELAVAALQAVALLIRTLLAVLLLTLPRQRDVAVLDINLDIRARHA